MKLFLKRCIIISIAFLFTYIFYSNYRINGSWIKITKNWHETISIIDFNFFKRSVYNTLDSVDDIHNESIIAFGNSIFLLKNDSSILEETIMLIKKINNDSIIFKDYYERNSEVLYKKIPHFLKQKNTLKLENKLYELKLNYKDSTFIDTIYFSKKYHLDKNSSREAEWNINKYKILNINGFNIILFDINSYAILKEKNNQLYFYQFEKNKDKLLEIQLKRINNIEMFKGAIDKKIKEFEEYDTNKHPHQ